MITAAQILETVMLICFGASWPISVVKSWRARSAKGKSVIFLSAILVGYLCGIASKLSAGNTTYIVWLYALNFTMVAVDFVITLRNKRLDARAEAKSEAE